MDNDKVKELLERICDIGSGTRVTNCVAHVGLPLIGRPTDCSLCSQDVQNHLRVALDINRWLNAWMEDAKILLNSSQE